MKLTIQEQCKWKPYEQKQKKYIKATKASIYFSIEIKTRFQRGRVAYKCNISRVNQKKMFLAQIYN